MSDFTDLTRNFDSRQMELLGAIAMQIALIRSNKFTGQVSVVINAKDGSCCDVELQQRNRLWTVPGRRMRSDGI
jgi:hypothetical protein